MKLLKPSYKKIKYQGKKMTLREWSIELGIPYQTLYHRLRKGYDDIFSEAPKGRPSDSPYKNYNWACFGNWVYVQKERKASK